MIIQNIKNNIENDTKNYILNKLRYIKFSEDSTVVKTTDTDIPNSFLTKNLDSYKIDGELVKAKIKLNLAEGNGKTIRTFGIFDSDNNLVVADNITPFAKTSDWEFLINYEFNIEVI